MLTKAKTCALVGLGGQIVEVEVDISAGLPAFNVVGLPDTAVQESRERVRAAIRNSGFEFPMRRITVSLAPADLPKAGPSYDLPIAVAILGSSGQLDASLEDTALLGELSLEGQLRHTDGVLPMVGLARAQGLSTVAVPGASAPEASLVTGLDVLGAASLGQLVERVQLRAANRTGAQPPERQSPEPDRRQDDQTRHRAELHWRPPYVQTQRDDYGHSQRGVATVLRSATYSARTRLRTPRWGSGCTSSRSSWIDTARKPS